MAGFTRGSGPHDGCKLSDVSETGDRVLFLDCASGASGDMLAAALLDVAARAAVRAPAEVLDEVVRPALSAIGVDPAVVTTEEVRRGGLAARRFVVAEASGFATFVELVAALERSSLPEPVAATVAGAAARMAAAEREVHGEDEPHLHELAGLDTAVDLVSAAALLHHLAPASVLASPPVLGGGMVAMAHGSFAVPAPAVLAILRGLPTGGGGAGEEGELTTPTGAALLATIVSAFGSLPAGRVVAGGNGAGSRELAGRANVLRAVLVEPVAASRPAAATGDGDDAEVAPPPDVELLETNLDDLTPEMLAHAAEALRAAGALDVWSTNALMKKGRPGVVLHALVRPADRAQVADVLFRETSTFGVRLLPVRRLYLDERSETVSVGGHDIRIRLGYLEGRLVTVTPEYEDCAAAAGHAGLAVKEVHETALAFARRRFATD